jgi:methyl-accepting chemotaxis protein
LDTSNSSAFVAVDKVINPVMLSESMTKSPIVAIIMVLILRIEVLLSTDENMNWLRLPMLKEVGLWTDPYYDFFLQEYVITYSEPIFVNAKPVGVVGADILLKDFEQFVFNIEVYKTGYAFLINKNHDILAHPTLGIDANMRTIDNGTLIQASNYISLYQHGTFKYTFLGQNKIMGFDRLHNGWTIGVSPPIEEINTALISTRRSFFIVFITCIFVFLIIGMFLSRFFSRPIELLTETVIKIGKGHLETPVSYSLMEHPSEIGLLAKTINEMRIRQKKSFDKLVEHNETLDQEVAERTNDLLESNKKLEATVQSLTSAQQEISEMREQEAIHDLINHLANKLSTPVMTTITASNYLLTQTSSDRDGQTTIPIEKVSQSAHLIHNNQVQVKNILDSLKQLISSYSDEKARHLPLRAHLNHTLKNELSEHPSTKIDYELEGDEQLMIYLPMDLTTKLISNFLHHSIQATEIFDNQKIKITFSKENKLLHLNYHDIIPWQSGIREGIFDPHRQSEFTKGSKGLELYLIKHIVIKAFGGTITPFETDHHTLGFHIVIPEKTEHLKT